MNELLAHFGYIVSILMFMVGIMLMGRVKTAKNGNRLAAGAMLLAVIAQLVQMKTIDPVWIVVGLVVGALIGAVASIRVQMTQMPEMVALFNGSGGLASLLVAVAAYAYGGIPSQPLAGATIAGSRGDVNGLAVMLSILIGGVTFTGSIIAFLKLAEKMSGKPILLPGRHAVNILLAVLVAVFIALGVWVLGGGVGLALLVLVILLSFIMGITLVIPIGGGDMPVVISLLNSYSGVAAAMAGFALGSHVLIVSGSLVGAAGLILTQIMCKAMNRSLANVVFGGFGAEAATGGGGEYKNVKSADAETAAMVMADAQSIIIVPGYGMAVSQAQHAVRELAKLLEAKGASIRYAIHPVAGRMPGHMNVLLAEANVPYEQLFEMDQINEEFKSTDVVLVIGANDTVNPAAKTDKTSPLYGMPVMNVEEAKTVFTMKRSLGGGFAQVKNTLFECPNNFMIYGDARKTLEEIAKAVKEG
ncbi:MAG: NAD(P)(+) transhydrogenase (Re/Si-specific) subunit beta [Planctomycetes bacterium]|nr:NAD(P)(+) transhydrogenase (Re/Si-specific) subunit beta [Planctomycetota bacterium]MCW8136838.1 NAD(P)(+) transhydrogenase (Re/Si-specific) subunit beta [Planctomycetota bacterium]